MVSATSPASHCSCCIVARSGFMSSNVRLGASWMTSAIASSRPRAASGSSRSPEHQHRGEEAPADRVDLVLAAYSRRAMGSARVRRHLRRASSRPARRRGRRLHPVDRSESTSPYIGSTSTSYSSGAARGCMHTSSTMRSSSNSMSTILRAILPRHVAGSEPVRGLHDVRLVDGRDLRAPARSGARTRRRTRRSSGVPATEMELLIEMPRRRTAACRLFHSIQRHQLPPPRLRPLASHSMPGVQASASRTMTRSTSEKRVLHAGVRLGTGRTCAYMSAGSSRRPTLTERSRRPRGS